MADVPLALSPIRLPRTMLPWALNPAMVRPTTLPDKMLRLEPLRPPPMFLGASLMRMPDCWGLPVEIAREPERSTPTRFPWTMLRVAAVPEITRPSEVLPEIWLPAMRFEGDPFTKTPVELPSRDSPEMST